MSLDIQALVAPLSDEQPSGPDFYGDVKRLQIEQAFERSVSDGGVAQASASEWQDTIDLILEQCGATRDIWLPIYLMRAAARSGQLDLLAEAAELLAALTETRWADVHPQLEDLGFIGRKTPCESLTRIGDFLAPLEQLPLVVHPRLGPVSGADFERVRELGKKAPGFAEFRLAVDGVGPDALTAALAALATVDAAIRRVDSVLTTYADGDTGTNFSPTYAVLAKLRKAVTAQLPQDKAPAVIASAGNSAGTGSGDEPRDSGTTGAAFTGTVASREDVAQALDSICEYYARFEPSSPVPFILRRAKDWISLDFLAVLEDIAPASLEDAGKVFGTQRAAGAADWSADPADSAAASSGDDADAEEEVEDDGWN